MLRETPQKDAAHKYYIREKSAERKLAWASGTKLKWLKLSAARWALVYGESPWRVGLLSIFTILIFSLYPVFGVEVSAAGNQSVVAYDGTSGSVDAFSTGLYYSLSAFTRHGADGIRPVGAGEMLSIVESVIGSLSVALLVFVLGRKTVR